MPPDDGETSGRLVIYQRYIQRAASTVWRVKVSM
jgi:hypothetical protein